MKVQMKKILPVISIAAGALLILSEIVLPIIELIIKMSQGGSVGIIGGADAPIMIYIVQMLGVGNIIISTIVGVVLILAGIVAIKKQKIKKNHKKTDVKELKELSGDELRTVITEYLLAEEEKNGWEVEKCLKEFKGAKKVFYIVNYFDMEVMNGGLCQFFVNSSRELAPYISDCLHTIGATKYEKLYSDFVVKNNIDLRELDSFIIDEVDEYEAQTERYPFDDFDDKYYELYECESLEEMLVSYVKQNLDDFICE